MVVNKTKLLHRHVDFASRKVHNFDRACCLVNKNFRGKKANLVKSIRLVNYFFNVFADDLNLTHAAIFLLWLNCTDIYVSNKTVRYKKFAVLVHQENYIDIIGIPTFFLL